MLATLLSFTFLRSATSAQCSSLLLTTVDPLNGYTSSHLAASYGHFNILKTLLDVDSQMIYVKDRKGCLPVHLAAWNGYIEAVKVLLEFGLDTIDAVNNAKESPLHLSTQHAHTNIVAYLLMKNADARTRNARNETALDIAARLGKADICRLIVCNCPELALQNAADCSSTIPPNGTAAKIPSVYPVHAAARYGQTECVQILCQSGFDVNYVTDEGSALNVAALFGKADTVKFLLQQGVNVNLCDCQGRTVLETLSEHENERAVGLTQLIQSREGWSECRKIIEAHIDECNGESSELDPYNFYSLSKSNCSKIYQNIDEVRMDEGDLVWRCLPEGSYIRKMNCNAAQNGTSSSYDSQELNEVNSQSHAILNQSDFSLSKEIPVLVDTFSLATPKCGSPFPLTLVFEENLDFDDNKMPRLPLISEISPKIRGKNLIYESGVYDNVILGRLSMYNDAWFDANRPGSHTTAGAVFQMDALRGSESSAPMTLQTDDGARCHNHASTESQRSASVDFNECHCEYSSLLRCLQSGSSSTAAEVIQPISDSPRKAIYTETYSCESPFTIVSLKGLAPLAIPEDTFASTSTSATSITFDHDQHASDETIFSVPSQLRIDPIAAEFSPNEIMGSSHNSHLDLSNIAIAYALQASARDPTDSTRRDYDALATLSSSDASSTKKSNVVPCLISVASSHLSASNHSNLSSLQSARNDHKWDSLSSQIGFLQEFVQWNGLSYDLSNSDIHISLEECSNVESCCKAKSSTNGDNGSNVTGTDDFQENSVHTIFSTPKQYDTVAEWLNLFVGIPNPKAFEIAKTLESNGFDRVQHMKSTLDKDSMQEIGLDKSIQHQIICLMESHVCKSDKHENFTYVSDWLHSLDLEDYLGHFMRNGLTTMLTVTASRQTTESLSDLGVVLIGHQKRILNWLKQFEANTVSTGFRLRFNSDVVDIGQKNELNKSTKWLHSSSRLIDHCIEYAAHYLGSVEISNIDGTEESRRAMIQLKKDVREMTQILQVLLQISIHGIRIFRLNTKELLHEHKITKVRIVCQDDRDLNCFAYISKDENLHFCHVFCVLTADIATEIIITLGQTFEVCYNMVKQMIEKEKILSE